MASAGVTSPYRIEYSVPATGAERVLPFVIGVIADVVGNGRRSADEYTVGRFVDIDREGFDAVMAALRPRLDLRLPAATGAAAEIAVSLAFTCLDDFGADRIVPQVAIPCDGPGTTSRDEERRDPARLLAAILGHPDFIRLERGWRGLHHLATLAGSSPLLRIRLLNCPRHELDRDLGMSDAVEHAHVFKLLHDEPYGHLDGEPLALVVADFDIADQVSDMALAERLATLAATCFAPMLLPAAPAFAAMLASTADGAAALRQAGFDDAALERWQRLRDSHEAGFVVLTADVLAGPASAARAIGGPYIVAGQIAAAFARDEWAPSFMDRGLNAAGNSAAASDVHPGNERAAALASHGLLPIMRGSGDATLAHPTVLARRRTLEHPSAQLMADTLATLPPILGGSRIMHYLLMQYFALAAQSDEAAGDVVPDARRAAMERLLLDWLSGYRASRPAPAPLHDALVRLTPDRDHPAYWWMVAFLLPAWNGGGALPTSARFAARVPVREQAQPASRSPKRGG